MTWTLDVVFDALREAKLPADVEFEIFLQGSFANNTNISPIGDVDIVVMMTMPLEENIVALDGLGRKNFAQRYEPSIYGWREFRADVLKAARRCYFITEGKRCLDVKYWDSLLRVPVDVLPAIEYRLYHSFDEPGREDYEEGVYFRHRNGVPIINYPKLHIVNGFRKEQATGGRSKSVVRIVKHIRDHVKICKECPTDERDVMAGAPSYYLECLIHNVPNWLFRGPLPDVVSAVTDWLADRSEASDWSSLKCQNGIADLFGGGLDQWNPATAREVVGSLRRLCTEAAR